jgi:hypothetical protein
MEGPMSVAISTRAARTIAIRSNFFFIVFLSFGQTGAESTNRFPSALHHAVGPSVYYKTIVTKPVFKVNRLSCGVVLFFAEKYGIFLYDVI